VLFGLLGCTAILAEAAVVILTFAPMFNVELPSGGLLHPVTLIGAAAIAGVLFWGTAAMDLLGWTHLADWPMSGWRGITFKVLTGLMLVSLLVLLLTGAVYREELVTITRSAEMPSADVLRGLARLTRMILMLVGFVAFMTALVAGAFLPKLCNLGLASAVFGPAALGLGITAVVTRPIEGAARWATEIAKMWFGELAREQEARQERRAARLEARRQAAEAKARARAEGREGFTIRFWPPALRFGRGDGRPADSNGRHVPLPRRRWSLRSRSRFISRL
jgi:hypothetical protein